ncbi:MAG: type II toxin-antitoxin system VapC family toxin [Cyanobacteria bacterium]|nr:type II toxin-antitoxin system VapC family toxin [Cyanobacteriota bacterium]
MNLTADTNVLVRALVADDPAQAAIAIETLRQAEAIAVLLPVLWELVWVLRRVYGFSVAEISGAIRSLLDAEGVRVDRPAVEAGLALLEAGGDFADGLIAHEGQWLGGERFVSFDRQAVALLKTRGVAAELLPLSSAR